MTPTNSLPLPSQRSHWQPCRTPLALLTTGTRPASIAYRGGCVNIACHDDWFAKCKRSMLAELKHLHPDREMARGCKRGKFCFLRMSEHFQQFMREQLNWYSTFGLLPPRVGGASSRPKRMKRSYPLATKGTVEKCNRRLPYVEASHEIQVASYW